jgi:hypothetical protein
MLLTMVYWDQDIKKTPKVEKSLRSRPKGLDSSMVEDTKSSVDIDKLVDLVHKQAELVQQQNNQIKILTDVLTKNLDKSSEPKVIYVEGTKLTTPVTTDNNFELPTLNECLDADVIDTSGIEVGGGSIGHSKTEGESISDRITRLKELKKKKKEK